MADDRQGEDLDGDDPAFGSSEGGPSSHELGSDEASGASGSGEGDRFDPGLDEALSSIEATADGERSRVDGLPDDWLDDPGAEDVADGPDVLVETNPDDDPEASGVSHSSRVQIGTGQSGITSPSDVLSLATPTHDRPEGAVEGEDRFLTGDDPSAEDVAGEGDRRAEDEKPADEWRDIVATARDGGTSESIGFGAFVGAADVVDPAVADSFHGDSQGIGESPGESFDIGSLGVVLPAAVPAGPIVTSGPRRSAVGGGLGQVVGVVLGGVLAIPVTLAILLFGFQRDPLRITPHLPAVVRSILPARFRPAAGERRLESDAGGVRRLTLDQIPDVSSSDKAPSDGVSETVVAGPVEPAPDTVESLAGDLPADGIVAPPVDRVRETSTTDPAGEIEIVVDPIEVSVEERRVGTNGTDKGIDFSALDSAIAAATSATDSLGEAVVGTDPAVREQAQVGWYRSLSVVALELAGAERAAIESGRPGAGVVGRFADLGRRLAVERHDDLEILGSMWLASEKRPSEGAVIIATLEGVRPVGPWWGGRLSVGGETPVALSFLSERAPRAESGERVMVVGVIGDPGTIWAVDVGALPEAVNPTDDPGEPGSF